MGYLFDIYNFKTKNRYNGFPLISCASLSTTISIFSDYEQVALGEQLSAVLKESLPQKRLYLIESEIENILSNINNNNILVMNIDILFNPDYKLDIIKLFIKLSRNRNLVVQWPGELSSGHLIYSKPEYIDYKRYSIKDYDVVCLK